MTKIGRMGKALLMRIKKGTWRRAEGTGRWPEWRHPPLPPPNAMSPWRCVLAENYHHLTS